MALCHDSFPPEAIEFWCPSDVLHEKNSFFQTKTHLVDEWFLDSFVRWFVFGSQDLLFQYGRMMGVFLMIDSWIGEEHLKCWKFMFRSSYRSWLNFLYSYLISWSYQCLDDSLFKSCFIILCFSITLLLGFLLCFVSREPKWSLVWLVSYMFEWKGL